MSFKKDLKLGQSGEGIVLSLFKRHGIDLAKNSDKKKLKDYDLVGDIGTKKITAEVKYDAMSGTTGNLAIEYNNPVSGKKSGIDATKAKLWIHIIIDNGFPTVWAAKTKSLKEYINKTKPWKVISRAGDGNASLKLYEVDGILAAVFKRIDNVSTEQFTKIIKNLI